MAETILRYLDHAGIFISLVAVLVIIVGFASGAARYALRPGGLSPDQRFYRFKVELGHALTLALEILVLADVIETITVKPSFQSLAVLAVLVVLRTALSWTLTLEIEGRWPWQTVEEESGDA